ncbi:serine hydrolase domain-containing protein [Oceanicaulis sp. LC35]|uniref:serine hydrolase domain-containing protein n=1 Tax=Oceanicaulis sp. LC35 TaxID=3349635 RepID=UPI003F84FFFA
MPSFRLTPALSALMLGAAALVSTPILSACQPASAFTRTGPESFTDSLRGRFSYDGVVERYTLEERMAHYGVPGVAVAVIEDGQIVFAQGYGVLQAGSDAPVTADTVFSAGSVSKMATAFMTLNLVQSGALDLDADISHALPYWSPDASAFGDAPLTVRMLLSHTGGLNLHGFADFLPGEALPTRAQTLNGQAPAEHDPLRIEARPGMSYRYSGGGYTLLEGLIAQATGMTFEDSAEQALFGPLGMSRSSFANPLPEDYGDIAKAHDRNGAPAALPRGYEAFPEMAASGLWTSANDLARLTAEMINAYRGQSGYLHPVLGQQMMTQVSPSEHGLGPRLEGRGESFIFHHGGTNNSYRTWMEGHLATGDGLVILTNGANGMDLAVEIRNAMNDVMGWTVNPVLDVPSVRLTEAQLARYEGVYSVDPDFPLDLQVQMAAPPFIFDLTIYLQNGQLMASYNGGQNGSPLVPVAPDRFYITDFSLRSGVFELKFNTNALAQVTSVEASMASAETVYLPAS